ncbi:MAG: phage tail protein, partial [Dongiaceae bacterium]
YGRFNFLVSIDGLDPAGPRGGFMEVDGLGVDIAVIEYRNGNERQNTVRKLPGLHKAGDVTLKRGIIGALDLWQWLDAVRNGDIGARRNVAIDLLDESRQAVMRWLLHNAWPAKYRGPNLSAKGNDVAIEELVLAYERLEVE